MKPNEVLQKQVQEALKAEPLLQPTEIGVIVKDGIVTLTGEVESFAKKKEAVEAVKKVRGIGAVIDDIEVLIGNEGRVPDSEIAADALRMLNESLIIPKHAISITVDNGHVTLEGTLIWNFQREIAAHLLKDLPGVSGITNTIRLKKEIAETVEKEKIEQAFRRHWSIDPEDIDVAIDGSTVNLSGTVCSLFQREEAERIVYKTPGVSKVINKLKVDFELPYLC